MAKKKINSREKGADYERHIAKVIRKYGFEAERGCQHSGGKDSPDVKHNMPGIHIEAKATEKLSIWKALAQSKRDAGEGEIPVVVFKRNYSGDFIVLPFEDFLKIFKKGQDNG